MFISSYGQLLTEIKSGVVQSKMIILSLFNSLFKRLTVTNHIFRSLGSNSESLTKLTNFKMNQNITNFALKQKIFENQTNIH